ncbi:MAG TPA: ABC transporter permease [Bryobacteraceae bacterium]|jgi:predicted permease|nr:ABC transporter permease [Bryobacteraceae bacterium]
MNTFLESLIQDLRYGVRGLARNPMFTLTAVFAAALGIGATTAVFSVVDRILFRSLPYPAEDRLVSLGMMAPLDTNEFLFDGSYQVWRRQQTPFESITSFTAGVADCDLTENDPARLGCASVEANFLPTLGFSPILGRNFTEQEDRPNGPRVALISYALWQGRFARDPNVAGKIISIDAQPVTIIGVLPSDFEMPTLAAADLLVPQALREASRNNTRALRVFARLKPGVKIAQAQAAMQPLFDRMLESEVPPAFRKEVHLRMRSLRDRQMQDARVASWVLLFAVSAVLLIACANIANLLLARSVRRRREMAVRAALGAARSRLIRQTLTETLLLGLLGGVFGCALAWALLRFLVAIAPSGIPHLDQAALDGRVLLFALAGSLISGLVFGLAPAIQTPTAESLAGWRATGGRRMWLRESLVAAQIAVSVVLLTGAGMLLRSLWNLQNVPLGLSVEHVVTADFILGKQRYSEDVRQLQFFNELESRLRSIPGVTSFTISDSLPPYGVGRARPFAAIQVEGQAPFQEGTGGMVAWRYVTRGYFDTLGVPIAQGRGFEDRDRTPGESTIILSESLARKLFPNGSAVGHRIHTDVWSTVIGIAANVRNNGPAGETSPEYYMLRKPTPDEVFRNQMPPSGWRQAKVAIRTPVNPKAMAGWLKKEIAAIDPVLPVTVSTMQQRVSRLNDRPRFNAVLLSLFAAMGLVLAVIGLYGVMAFLVGQRTQEIGVRMALGATPRAIVKLILSHAAVWTVAGSLAGLAGSLFAVRAVRSLLFEVPEHDPWTFAVVLPGLLLVALAAAWIPSLRAARVDPTAALRHE